MWACKWTPRRSYAVTFSAWHEKLAWHIQHSTIWPLSPTVVMSSFSKPGWIFICNWLENNGLFLFNVIYFKLKNNHEFSFVLQVLSNLYWTSYSLLELWHFDNTWQRQILLPGSKSIYLQNRNRSRLAQSGTTVARDLKSGAFFLLLLAFHASWPFLKRFWSPNWRKANWQIRAFSGEKLARYLGGNFRNDDDGALVFPRDAWKRRSGGKSKDVRQCGNVSTKWLIFNRYTSVSEEVPVLRGCVCECAVNYKPEGPVK